ncbi:MAG: glycosyltransferase family 4 protein [Candidatus Dormibacteria bacterium]
MPGVMRITLVSYDDDPPIGGQGVVLRGLRAQLLERGVQVTTISGHGPHAVHIPRVTGRAPLDLSLLLNRRPGMLTAAAPDLLHAQGGPGGVLLWRRSGVPIVYTAHHTYRLAHRRGRPQRALGPLEAVAYRRAAMVLAVSSSTAQSLVAMGVSAARVEVLPPGIRVAEGGGAVREWKRLLFVGRQEAIKGPLDAVAVMRTVAEADHEVHGVVVGTGSQADAVRAACAAAGAGRIEFRGELEDAELAAEYARAAVVIVPSRFEGLGLVALEANAAGAAVAGYAVPGLRDSGVTGAVLVTPGDRAALVGAVHSLLADPARRCELAAAGRERIASHYSWAAHANRVLEVYRAVLASG